MDALFYLYIIFVVVVFVKDEFKDKDDTTRDYCINHCKYGRVFHRTGHWSWLA